MATRCRPATAGRMPEVSPGTSQATTRSPTQTQIVDEIMMHCVVDQVTIGIADAAQFQPQGN